MTDAIRDSFRAQAEVCTAMGSPFMGALLHGLARDIDTDTATGRRVLTWPGDPSARGDALALRLAGALHRLVLTGADAGLARVYPGGRTPATGRPWDLRSWPRFAAMTRRWSRACPRRPRRTRRAGRQR